MSEPEPSTRCATELIEEEYARAIAAFPDGFRSPHEGYAILLEEVDELWDEVKGKRDPETMARMKKEAVQVGAMAVRFLVMLGVPSPTTRSEP